MEETFDWRAIRAEFPSLQNAVYLNTATYGQVPLRSQRATQRHFERRDELACADFLTWFDDMDELRSDLARLIHCSADDIAFVNTASAALSLFLGGMEWAPGDRIVTLADEFPNQYYYATLLRARGAELLELPEIDRIPERTRAVVLSSVNYSSGYRPDLKAISRMAHEAGALVYIDGTQSLGALRFDVTEVQPDLFAVDGYKWLMCPNGATFFYISPELRQILPPAVIGWRSDQGWRGVDDLRHGAPRLPEGAERYEGGMLNFPSLYAMQASVRMISEIGPERIEKRVLSLAALAGKVLQEFGADVRNTGSNVVAGRWPSGDAPALAKELASQRIIVAARHGNLRVSPHFYNDESDLKALSAALAEIHRQVA